MRKILALLLAIAIMTSLVEAHDHHHHDHDHDHDHNHQGHDEHHHHSHPHDTEGKYATESHVLILTDDTLPQAIEQFPLLLVKFFAPWCGHCKTLAPTYKQLAIDLAYNGHQEYAIAEVDCTIHKIVCNTHGIRGYPSLKYFIDGESHPYSGSRSKDALAEFLHKKQLEVRNTSTQQQL